MNDSRMQTADSPMSPPAAEPQAVAFEVLQSLFKAWQRNRGLGLSFDQAALLHEAKSLSLPRDPAALAKHLSGILDLTLEDVPEREWRLFNAALTKLAADMKGSPSPSVERTPQKAGQRGRTQETAISRDVTCHECGAENPAQRNFCGKCGAGLWCICPGCSSHVPADEAFCGVCGYAIGEELVKYRAKIRQLIERAEELIARQKPWDAAACLEQIPSGQRAWWEHARVLRKVEELQAILAPALARRKAEIEAVAAQAAELAAAGDYEQAVRTLAAVPSEMQTPEIQAACALYTRRIGELRHWESQLASCLQKKDLSQTLNAIRQLLALNPNHRQSREVATKLVPIVKKMVERHLQDNRFADALRILEMLPETACDAELTRLRGALAAITGTLRFVRAAHYTYPYLESMVAALGELLPPDHPPVLTQEELARVQAPIENPGAWCRLLGGSSSSSLGSPVEWITCFHRIKTAESLDAALLRRHPGGFLSATGAALQGIGAASLAMNLIPDDSIGLMGRLSRWLRPKSRSAWGVAFGSTKLRAVRAERDAANGDVTLTHLDLYEYEKPLSHAANRGQILDMLKESVDQVFSRQEVEADQLVLALPSALAITSVALLPRFDADQLETILSFEVKRLLPDKGENMTWRFASWGDVVGNTTTTSQTGVILGAMNRLWLNECMERLRLVNVVPDAVTTDVMALLNWLLFDYLGTPVGQNGSPSHAAGNGQRLPDDRLPLLLLDLGTTASHAIYLDPKNVRMVSLGIAGDSWIRSIAKELKLTYSAASKAAGDWRRIRPLDHVLPHLEQFRRQAYDDMKRLMDRIHRDSLESPRKILVTGGGACIPGLLDTLIQGPDL